MSATRFYKPLNLHQPGKLLPTVVNILVMAGLIYLLFVMGQKIIEMLQPVPASDATVSSQAPSTLLPAPEQPDASEDIAALNMFGQVDESGVDEAPDNKVAPDTGLDLTLRGIFAGDQVNHGFAIIQNNRDNEERYYTVQQSVFNLATLEVINDDHVILLHQGRYETLRLPKDSLSREHFYDSAEVKAEKKRVATNYRDRFLGRNSMDLINLFGFREAYKGGVFIGFRVSAVGEEGLDMMKTLGIEDGDLVIVLNGKRFSEGLEAFEEIKTLKTATSVDIIIDRNGNEIPFHFDLEPAVTASDQNAESTLPAGSDYSAEFDNTTVDQSAEAGVNVSSEANSNAGFDANSGIEDSDDVDWDNATPGVRKRRTTTGKDSEADLGVDWDETDEAESYKQKQRERMTEPGQAIEYDH